MKPQAWAVKHFRFMNSVDSSWMPPYSNVSKFWWAREDKSKPNDYQWLGSRERTCSQVGYKAHKFAEHLGISMSCVAGSWRLWEWLGAMLGSSYFMTLCQQFGSVGAAHYPKLSKDVGRVDGSKMKACKTFDLHETCHHLRLLNGLNGRLMISIVLALWSFGMSSKWPRSGLMLWSFFAPKTSTIWNHKNQRIFDTKGFTPPRQWTVRMPSDGTEVGEVGSVHSSTGGIFRESKVEMESEHPIALQLLGQMVWGSLNINWDHWGSTCQRHGGCPLLFEKFATSKGIAYIHAADCAK